MPNLIRLAGTLALLFSFAHPAAAQFTLTTQANPPGAGSVTFSTSQATFSPSSVVTLQAAPNQGYQFVSWSVTGGLLSNAAAGYAASCLNPADILPTSVQVYQADFTGSSVAVAYNINGTVAKPAELQMNCAFRVFITTGTITVQGNLGSAQVLITPAPTQAALIAAINSVTNHTGVHACSDGCTSTTTDFYSTDATGMVPTYGSSQYVIITPAAGQAFFTTDPNGGSNPASSNGVDAFVPTINSTSCGISVCGLNVTVNQPGLNLSFQIASPGSKASGTFTILPTPISPTGSLTITGNCTLAANFAPCGYKLGTLDSATGQVDPTDLDVLNARLNGFDVSPCTDDDCDLTGDGAVTTADRVQLRLILNGLASSRQP